MGILMELASCHPSVVLNFVVALRFLKNFYTACLLDGNFARRGWRKTPLVVKYHNPYLIPSGLPVLRASRESNL